MKCFIEICEVYLLYYAMQWIAWCINKAYIFTDEPFFYSYSVNPVDDNCLQALEVQCEYGWPFTV